MLNRHLQVGLRVGLQGCGAVVALAVVCNLILGSATAAPGTNGPAVQFRPEELNRCEATHKRQVSDVRNRIYDSVYSKYVEICAASTWQMRGANDGGNYGHAFGIIKGACVVKDANGKPVVPPQLKICDDGWVGVSSDYILFNVQWLAAEGRSFFLYGNHDAGEPLDQAAADRIKKEAQLRGVFEGVDFQKTYRKEIARDAAALGMSPAEYRPLWQGKASLGTDFAIAASRGGVHCTRIPMVGTKPGFEDKPLKDLVAHLNSVNLKIYQKDQYEPLRDSDGNILRDPDDGREKFKGFDYDPSVNNCTSNFSNALAAIGFRPMKNTEGHPEGMGLLARFGDVAVPYNDMFSSYKIGSEFDLEGTIEKMRSDKAAFEYFKTTGWLGSQAGVMLESIPALTYMNSVYDTSRKISFASVPFELQKKALAYIRNSSSLNSWSKYLTGVDLNDLKPIEPFMKREFDRIENDDSHRGVDMIENLRFWNALYTRYLQDLKDGVFGDDEVVSELKIYFANKVKETSLHLQNSAKLKASSLTSCQE